MGDSVNVVVLNDIYENQGTYLQARHAGVSLYLAVARALDTPEARKRWQDAPYLARVIFQHVLDAAGFSGDDWGIADVGSGGDWPTLVIDPYNERAALRDPGMDLARILDAAPDRPQQPAVGLTFEEFVANPERLVKDRDHDRALLREIRRAIADEPT